MMLHQCTLTGENWFSHRVDVSAMRIDHASAEKCIREKEYYCSCTARIITRRRLSKRLSICRKRQKRNQNDTYHLFLFAIYVVKSLKLKGIIFMGVIKRWARYYVSWKFVSSPKIIDKTFTIFCISKTFYNMIYEWKITSI